MRSAARAAVLAGIGALVVAEARAAESGDNTRYYEDDAWYDVTEWFDGNDYNPTDEAWWRWDDEAYQAAQDTSGDRDSDGWYGYTVRDDDDWYYDYYDPFAYPYFDDDNDGLYRLGYRYFDYDRDGFYDAYASYSDEDGDGLYDDYDYYFFDDAAAGKQRQRTNAQIARESRQRATTGTIRQMKAVQVPGGNQHVVVSIQPQSGAKKESAVVADLGRTSDLKSVNPKLGDRITVKGPQAKVGKQQVVLARSFELNGTARQVDRKPRSITGKVLSTHRTKIRGAEHLMAMVEASQGGRAKKLAVDLGRADRLKGDVAKGTQLTFSGFPVKVKDRPLIMASTVEVDGRHVQIHRQPSEQRGQASSGGREGGTTDRATSTGSTGGGAGELDDPARTGLDIPPSADESRQTDRPASTGLEAPPQAPESTEREAR